MKNGLKRFDPYVLFLAALVSLIGLLVIFDAGYARSMATGKGAIPREFIVQALSLVAAIGLGLWIAGQRVQKLFEWAKPLWALTIVSLILVKIPHIGYEMNGAHRWFKLGPLTLQPAEFAKVAVILYVAAILNKRKAWPKKLPRFKSFASYLETVGSQKFARIWPAIVVCFAAALVVIEPDLGTGAVVAGIAWILFAIGGVSRKSLVYGTLICIVGLGVALKMEPYRLERITNFQTRWEADQMDDMGYQTVQSEIAGAAGKWIGVGIGAGRAKHIMPAATTDFVTATVGEEVGFLGWLAMMLPIAALSVRLLQLAPRAPTQFGSLVLAGTGAWIGLQSVVNVMMANGSAPAIGIPLPFISSGGSSLIALWLALGCAQVALQPALVKQEASVETHRDRRGYGRTRFSGA